MFPRTFAKKANQAVALLSVLVITACSTNAGQDGKLKKEDLGTVAGAIGGALAAKGLGKGTGNVLAIAGGTLLGGYLGNQVGASLDRADLAYYNQTSQRALETSPTNVASSWVNPDSGASGTITPTRTFKSSSGAYCREYTQSIAIGGKTQEAVGTACRQPDGSWKIVE